MFSKYGSDFIPKWNEGLAAFIRTDGYAELCAQYGIEESCFTAEEIENGAYSEEGAPQHEERVYLLASGGNLKRCDFPFNPVFYMTKTVRWT